MLVTRRGGGYSARRLMNVGFIACSGETTKALGAPGPSAADIAATRSAWLMPLRKPDHTATAVYDAVWFSSESVY
jgi:hypothetical protein